MSSSSSSSASGSISARGRVTVDPRVLELGDLDLDQITMKIMEIPLQGPMGYFAGKVESWRGLLGKHDYIVVEYGSPRGEWIKAEKTGESRRGGTLSPAGLHLTLETGPDDAEGAKLRHQVRIVGPGPGVKWTMAKVTSIMSSHNPDYDLLSSNCWKYAFHCPEAILKWCIENAVDENVKKELLRELEQLKPLEKPMVSSVGKWFVNPSDPENIETGKVLAQKLNDTIGKLKESKPGSRRAKGLSKCLNFVESRNAKHRERPAGSSDETPQATASSSLSRAAPSGRRSQLSAVNS